MNKLEELYLEVIENHFVKEVYEEITLVIDPDERESLASKSAEITTDVAIKFAEFLCTYPDKNRNVYGEILHAKSKYDSSYTTKEVFKEFINNHYGK